MVLKFVRKLGMELFKIGDTSPEVQKLLLLSLFGFLHKLFVIKFAYGQQMSVFDADYWGLSLRIINQSKFSEMPTCSDRNNWDS